MIEKETRSGKLEETRLEFAERRRQIERDGNLTTENKDAALARLDEIEKQALFATGRRFDLDQMRSAKFIGVDAGIGDARTRAQALGGSGFNGMNAVIQTQAADIKKTAMSAEQQVQLLRSIDKGIQRNASGVWR
jgi:hypothetical protein